ncbi:MAG: hypothetical protein R2849_22515 [Thermomicrobiales bacterium]
MKIEAIFTAPAASEPMIQHERIRAIAGQGLDGDRYTLGTGFYSDGQEGRQLTLIEAEDLEQLNAGGVELSRQECRRNLVTSGVDLPPLIGKRFRIGDVLCEGIKVCPPCNHLEDLTRPGPLKGLARSGGIRAHILSDGFIAVGDDISVESKT